MSLTSFQFHPSEMLHNVTRAFDAYATHATLTGNSTSQALVAFFYATGYDNVVDLDQAKALLYYTFAAFGGNQGAQMALGYRHWAGIGVNDECMQSLEWYQMAAEQCKIHDSVIYSMAEGEYSNGEILVRASWRKNASPYLHKAVRFRWWRLRTGGKCCLHWSQCRSSRYSLCISSTRGGNMGRRS